ncbi:MAG: DUF1684 domain-containing protein, partial [Acidobacteriota bacterium]
AEYAAEIEEWRNTRLERLTADDGWLTLTGLFWLEPGDNFFGSSEDNAVVLPDDSIPGTAGRLILDAEGTVTLIAEEGFGIKVNGEDMTEAILKTDAAGRPDVVTAGRITFFIIDREGELGARVKDPESPARTAFSGIEHFPVNAAFRVDARLDPYQEPREVAIPTVLGRDTTMLAPGVLHFTIEGTEHTLEPYVSDSDSTSYFLIFRDATSAVSTYGAGRFLSADVADENGLTVLDFNLAYNPPCAFTPYATCPLPPPQNWLQASIDAGEQYHGETH